MIRMVVFDMAGTTVNEHNVVYKTLHRAIVQTGLDISPEDVLRIGAGKEKRQAIADTLLEYGQGIDDLDLIYDKFLEQLTQAYANLEVSLMPGTESVFRNLRKAGVYVVLNTGYNRSTALALLNKLSWQEDRDFDLLVTADQVASARPAPDMILRAMAHFCINDPGQVAKIGDSVVDIEEGRNAGCGLVFGITGGAQDAVQLQAAGPDAVISLLDELLPRLQIVERFIS